MDGPLQFQIIAKCGRSKARAAILTLPHSRVATPVFMPVGTQGTLKGILSEQLQSIDCNIMLCNTYHLAHRPGHELVRNAGGLHKFINWPRSLLTDSGGFQMVSLSELATVTENGVDFTSPHTGEPMTLTPEESIRIQNALGADIIMQLDDVVPALTQSRDRVREAMQRSIRWLDRCIAAHGRIADQSLFPIIQGGLDEQLRNECLSAMIQRTAAGFAIGGLSGGEAKHSFWRIVSLCTDRLPVDKPRYVMGVGHAIDLVVCVALGADMFDCVYPTRTARFGTALVAGGQLRLKSNQYADDFQPIDVNCPCTTCRRRYTRAYLHSIVTRETVACHLLSIHNICYQIQLMSSMHNAIRCNQFDIWIRGFIAEQYASRDDIPGWVNDALASVGIVI